MSRKYRKREKRRKKKRERESKTLFENLLAKCWEFEIQANKNILTFQLTFFARERCANFFFCSFSFVSLLICLLVRLVSFVAAATKKDREDVTIIGLNKYFHAPELLEVPVSENEKKKEKITTMKNDLSIEGTVNRTLLCCNY